MSRTKEEIIKDIEDKTNTKCSIGKTLSGDIKYCFTTFLFDEDRIQFWFMVFDDRVLFTSVARNFYTDTMKLFTELMEVLENES